MLRPTRLLAVLVLVALLAVFGALPLEAARSSPTHTLFVDTDIGVDDAVAIAWLLKQPGADIVGYTTVFGNASVENTTRNLLTLLNAAAVNAPVTVGAAEPLQLPRTRTGSFVHGRDGFWFQQAPADISALPHDAPAALATAARDNPGLTILALGPLTNIAHTIEQYPGALNGVRVVAIGGARLSGNITPVAEFNAYADPHALEVVLASAVQLELVTLNAFEQVEVNAEALTAALSRRDDAVSQLIAALTPMYAYAQNQGAEPRIAFADAAAAVYLFNPELASPTSALVRVIADDGYARGQTIIATTPAERIPLIADDAEMSNLADQLFVPGFDLNAALFEVLSRDPDNTQAVLAVRGRPMAALLQRDLVRAR